MPDMTHSFCLWCRSVILPISKNARVVGQFTRWTLSIRGWPKPGFLGTAIREYQPRRLILAWPLVLTNDEPDDTTVSRRHDKIS